MGEGVLASNGRAGLPGQAIDGARSAPQGQVTWRDTKKAVVIHDKEKKSAGGLQHETSPYPANFDNKREEKKRKTIQIILNKGRPPEHINKAPPQRICLCFEGFVGCADSDASALGGAARVIIQTSRPWQQSSLLLCIYKNLDLLYLFSSLYYFSLFRTPVHSGDSLPAAGKGAYGKKPRLDRSSTAGTTEAHGRRGGGGGGGRSKANSGSKLAPVLIAQS